MQVGLFYPAVTITIIGIVASLFLTFTVLGMVGMPPFLRVFFVAPRFSATAERERPLRYLFCHYWVDFEWQSEAVPIPHLISAIYLAFVGIV